MSDLVRFGTGEAPMLETLPRFFTISTPSNSCGDFEVENGTVVVGGGGG